MTRPYSTTLERATEDRSRTIAEESGPSVKERTLPYVGKAQGTNRKNNNLHRIESAQGQRQSII